MGDLVSPRSVCRRAAVVLLACASCSGADEEPASQSIPGVITVSGSAPWNSSCTGPSTFPGGSGGVVFHDAEVEPSIAVDPKDPKHLIGVWQQDRWSNGGANGVVSAVTFDGGHTWQRTLAKFSVCSNGKYQRATDPWVSIGPTGTAFFIAYAYDENKVNRAMLVARSTDRGLTWEDPKQLQLDTDPDFMPDKETVTADPLDAKYAYAVWDRITHFTNQNDPAASGPAWFARTTDGGNTWEPAAQIYDPGPGTQTISNQIAVLPGGDLVNVLMVAAPINTDAPTTTTLHVLRSSDHGATWPEAPVRIAEAQPIGVTDPKSRRGIRSGSVVQSIAVDRSNNGANGILYVVWEDARFSGFAREAIAISSSTDGGRSWSSPKQVNGSTAPAFTPAIAVAQGGKVGVSYYDLRRDDPADGRHLLVTQWLAVSTDGGASFTESVVGAPFDLQAAPIASGAWFLGDYQGLTTDGSTFLPFFVAIPAAGPANVYFRPADMATVGDDPVTLAARTVQQLWRGARDRWRFDTLFK